MNEKDEEKSSDYFIYRMKMPSEFQRTYQCMHCMIQYIEPNNVGQLNCLFHPGIVIEVNKIGPYPSTKRVYSCCGREVNPLWSESMNGCLKADHMNITNMIPNIKVDINDSKRVRYELEKRFERIVKFAILTIPFYMIETKAIMKAHLDNIIYDSTSSTSSLLLINTKEYTLNAIKEARLHSEKEIGFKIGEDASSSSGKQQTQKGSSSSSLNLFNHQKVKKNIEQLSIDLNEIKDRIHEQSQCSPVYEVYMKRKSSKRQKKNIDTEQVSKLSNSVWKDDPSLKDVFLNEEEEQEKILKVTKMDYLMNCINEESDDKTNKKKTTMKRRDNKDRDNIPFYIVKRIDNKRIDY